MPGPAGDLLKSGFTVIDSLIAKIGGGAVLALSSLSSIAANTVVANVTGSSAAPTAADPQSLTFADLTSGAGNIRMKVAPVGYAAVSVTSGGNQNYDYDPGENGRFTFLIKLSLANTGTDFAGMYEVEAKRVGGTMTLIGSAAPSASGVMTGITVTISATGGSLRVNIAHATGTTLAGRAHFSQCVEDAL